jgi:hypothetical protein
MEARGDSDMVNLVERSQVRDNIVALEVEMRKHEQLDLEVQHLFANGTYTRILKIPAGTLLTGQIHRHSCTNIMVKGRIRVVTEDDDYDLEGYNAFVSGPGIKKAAYALEDTIWINIHPWNGTDSLEQIEQEVIVPSYENLLSEGVKCLG